MNKNKKIVAFLLVCFMLSASIIPVSAAENDPFVDVNPSDWFYEDVMTLYERDIVNGIGNGYFSPNSYITEHDFLVLLYRMNGIKDIIEFSAYEEDKISAAYVLDIFAPNKENDLINLGITSLIKNKCNISRGKAISLGTEFFGIVYPISKKYIDDPFLDIKDYENGNLKNLYNDYLITAYHSGLVSGYGDGTIKPDANLTRAEACEILLTFEKAYLSGDIERPMPNNFDKMNIEFDCTKFSEYSNLADGINAIPDKHLESFKNENGKVVITDKKQSEFGYSDNVGGLYYSDENKILLFNNNFNAGTMHHEFGHYLWFKKLTSEDKAAILKSYNSNELANFTEVTRDYGKTNVSEYWADFVMYRLEPDYKNAVENCGCETALSVVNKYFN